MAVVIAKDGTDPEGVPNVAVRCARGDQEGGDRAIPRTGRFRISRKWSRRVQIFELSVKTSGKSHQIKLDANGKPLK